MSSASRRIEFLGCPLDLITTPVLLAELKAVIDTRSGTRVIQFTNANKIAQVSRDPYMGDLMRRAHYVLTDGQPLLPMGWMLGVKIPERIDGIGLLGKLLRFAEENGFSIYLLGAKQEVLEACVASIREKHPSIRIAGFRNGYFTPDEAIGVAAAIRDANPDILFLGMGTPMKEKFADAYASSMNVPVVQGVGGSFDVIAGVVKRAPVWVQQIGMEWLFRVMQEPRRMAWRYATTNFRCLSVFTSAWCQHLISFGRRRNSGTSSNARPPVV